MNAERVTKALINNLLSESENADWNTVAEKLEEIFNQKEYNVNMPINPDGQTTLLLATINKKDKVVKWLLENYKDAISVSEEDITGQSPLSAAISNNDEDMFLLLVQNETNPPVIKDVKGANKVTPLMFAIEHNMFLSFLLYTLTLQAEDFNFYDTDTNGKTALDIFMRSEEEAFDHNHANSMVRLLSKFKFMYKISFIYFLIDNNYKFIYKIFYAETINEINKKDGYTLLFYAVKNKKHDSVKTLLDAGADPNITCIDDGQEYSGLILSIKNLDYEIALTFVLNDNININYATPKGKTALIALSEIEWTEFKYINIYDLMLNIFKKKETLRKKVVSFMLSNLETPGRLGLGFMSKIYEFITKQEVIKKNTEMLTVFQNIIDMAIKGVNDVRANPNEGPDADLKSPEVYLRYIKLFLAETDGSITLNTEMDEKETFLSYAEDKSPGFSKIITDYVFPPME